MILPREPFPVACIPISSISFYPGFQGMRERFSGFRSRGRAIPDMPRPRFSYPLDLSGIVPFDRGFPCFSPFRLRGPPPGPHPFRVPPPVTRRVRAPDLSLLPGFLDWRGFAQQNHECFKAPTPPVFPRNLEVTGFLKSYTSYVEPRNMTTSVSWMRRKEFMRTSDNPSPHSRDDTLRWEVTLPGT